MSTPEPPPDPWTLGPPPPAGPLPGPPPAAPPYGPPPGSWSGYPAAPRKRRTWILWVVLAAVLVVGGCAAVIGTVGYQAYRTIDGAKSALNDYLSAVERGDGPAAQRLRCDELLPETFATTLEPGIISHHIVGVGVSSGRGLGSDTPRSTATVTAEVTFGTGERRRDVFDLVRENGHWVVCGVQRGPAR